MTHEQEIAYMQSEEHLWERTLQDVANGATYLRLASRHRKISDLEKALILEAKRDLLAAAYMAEFQPIEFHVPECNGA